LIKKALKTVNPNDAIKQSFLYRPDFTTLFLDSEGTLGKILSVEESQ